MEERRDETSYGRWSGSFRNIGVGLYIAVVLLEVGMFFVLKSQNMIEQTIPVYLVRYMFKPIFISTLIMTIGSQIIRRTSNVAVKKNTHLIMITLMFGNVAMVHSVFIVTLIIFCIPVFLTVVFQDKKLLNIITVISEAFVVYIAVRDYTTQTGAGNDAYHIPTVIIAMVLIIACNRIATTVINVLSQQHEALIKATQEAKEAQRQADESNRSKSEFLSNMSHEIRTPINAVLGLDEMIIRESSDPVVRDYAIDIRSSGKALLGLVNDVLDFSKIESGKLDLVPVVYDVSSMVNDLVNMIANRAEEKGLEFEVEVASKIPHLLYGDEIRIKQIIMNLLTNAVKYTEHGEVKLCMDAERCEDNHIKLKVMVRDTGKGIKKEDLEKLFAPFERIDEKKNRNIEGTGLGMSITKNLLALMNSELKVESVYKVGSDFSFEIVQKVEDWEPVGDYKEAYRKIKEREAQYKEQFTAPDARIMVVDDTPINLKVVQNLLKKTLVQIDVTHSGKECIKMALKNRYDVIFIDHMMPEMDGVEVLNHLRNDENSINKDSVMVALSANAIAGSREFYLESGFDEYLTKPIDPSKLESMLIKWLPDELVKLS